MYKEVEPQNDCKLCLSTSGRRLKISEHQACGWTRFVMTYAFLAFIAFIAFLGAAAAAFAAFLAILLSTGERSKPQGMRMSLKTSFLEQQKAT